ncbi:MAG: AmmeMemoRadiSam system protein A [Myxococcales bacterium]|nr:AmmeMemoRadiSam system protein A [Myxococcales bacterium]
MRVPVWWLAVWILAPGCGTRGARTTEAGNAPAPAADVASASGGAPAAGAAAVEHEGEGPTPAERRLLLALARAAIDRRLAGENPPELDPSCITPYLAKPLACFVTLNTSDGDLRGCIGMFEAQTPLWENVMDRARAAAFADGRFPPVRAPELPGLVIDISILTTPQPFEFSSPEDLRDRLRPLVDGVILHSPWGSSTFLPQVWEDLPDREEFLGHLCRKHGAPERCWRDPELRVETYQAIVFSEHEHPPREGDWFALDASGRYRCTAPPADERRDGSAGAGGAGNDPEESTP